MNKHSRKFHRRLGSHLETLEARQLLAAIVGISATDAVASERAEIQEANPGKFIVKRTGSLDAPLTVNFTIGGTAVKGTDYAAIESSVTIPAGKESQSITIKPINDDVVEPTEKVELRIVGSDEYSINTERIAAVVGINDNDVGVSIVSADATAAERAAGQEANPGKFMVKRTGSLDAPLTVNFTVGGTAVNGTDYAAIETSVTIPAGSEAQAITISPINDDAVEATEKVEVKLVAGDKYKLNGERSVAAVAILDNDAVLTSVVSVIASDATASERATGEEANPGQFTVRRTGSLDAPLTVKFTVGGTAVNGTDYTGIESSVTIPAGKESQTITIAPKNDDAVEPTEKVELKLVAGEGYVVKEGGGAALVAINDNDVAPTLVSVIASDATASERATGEEANPGQFTVRRTGSLDAPLTVKFTVGGTAVNGTDYTGIESSVTIPAGKESQTITIAPKNDDAVEPTEKVELKLVAGEGYVVKEGGGAALVAINDNDVAPTLVSVIASDAAASERATGAEANPGQFTVRRTGSLDAPLTVKFTVGGTAVNGTDYTGIETTVTIPAGKESQTITIAPKDDDAVEPIEKVELNLVAGEGYLVKEGSGAALVAISDNDVAPTVVSIIASDATASERAAGQEADPGQFTVKRTGSLDAPLTVKFTVGGTAVNGTDYTGVESTVTIPAGKESQTITIAPINDSAVELKEKVELSLVAGEGYVVNAERALAGVLILDNDVGVSIQAVDGSAGETAAGLEGNPGKFIIKRTGPLDSALTVLLGRGGTAVNGTDYQEIAASIVILAGAETATINLSVIDDAIQEAAETVVLELLSSAAYSVNAEQRVATVSIADNDLVK